MVKKAPVFIMISLLIGCSRMTPLNSNPTLIEVTKHISQSNRFVTKKITNKKLRDQIITQINKGKSHIIPKGSIFNCPNTKSSETYDIIIYYNNFKRSFTLTKSGCTFLYDKQDDITLNIDVPEVYKLFKDRKKIGKKY